jgi:hypothetical protein
MIGDQHWRRYPDWKARIQKFDDIAVRIKLTAEMIRLGEQPVVRVCSTLSNHLMGFRYIGSPVAFHGGGGIDTF